MSEGRALEPVEISAHALFDTGVWSWVRDRRFPELSSWFNAAAANGLVLVSDLVALELTRLSPNAEQASQMSNLLAGFEQVSLSPIAWSEARDIQMAMTDTGDHRRVQPIDILHAVTAVHAGVPLIHYDRDYERIAVVSGLDQRWFVPDGSLA